MFYSIIFIILQLRKYVIIRKDMKIHPKWATKHKKKGTELRFLNGRYYLYEVTSKWNPEKKRSQKITGKLLGKITKEDGFVESDKAKLRKKQMTVTNLSVKEYGPFAFVEKNLGEYAELLKTYFPDHWKYILVLVYGRFVHQCPMKSMEFHYQNSYISEKYKKMALSPKKLSSILKEIGSQREEIVKFTNEFVRDNDHILFDGTDLVSNSRKMSLPKTGKSKRGGFEKLVNIMFVFSVGLQLPIYYRLIPGNIKDIKAFKLCLKESNVKDAVVIADKGFYSKNNIIMLMEEKLQYIIPLRRNNSQIDYSMIKSGDMADYDGYFKYSGRIIWYYTIRTDNGNIYVYMDQELKNEEMQDFVKRTETLPEKYTMEAFMRKQYAFGSIAILSNIKKTPEEVFVNYKTRSQVETMIDAMKNLIGADSSYMQNEQALEAWMFINYIALHWYYHLLNALKTSKLNHKFSPMDLIAFLKEVRYIKINNKWHLAETTKKYNDILKAVNIHIT